jgi:hypothetical protein
MTDNNGVSRMNDGKITPPKPGGPQSRLNYDHLVIMGDQVHWTTAENAALLRKQKAATFARFPAIILTPDELKGGKE